MVRIAVVEDENAYRAQICEYLNGDCAIITLSIWITSLCTSL